MPIKSQIETKLDAEIESLLAKLKEIPKDSKEYIDSLERISKLHKLKTEEAASNLNATVKEHEMETQNRFKRINPDTVLVVAANIFGILWLARYERENVIKSRNALNFVMKPR